jgi:arylsulfatase A-like enzyme
VDNMTGEEVLRAIRERPADQPFCIFGSFCGPHKPYDPPRSIWEATPHVEADDFLGAGRDLPAAVKARLYRLRRSYQAMITCIDIQIGRILDLLEAEGLADDTLVLFTSDHGEMLGDHGRMSKQQTCRQSAVVPTAIRVPGRSQGAVIDAPVELTDLTATMLDYAGLDPQVALARSWPAFNDRVPCRSLRPYLEETATDDLRAAAFSECGGQWQMLRSRRWQYVRRLATTPGAATREELYDLRTDPETQRDIAAEPAHAATLAEHRARLAALLDATPPAQLSWAPYGPRV